MDRRREFIAAGCDPVARKKIKELEKAVGGGSGGGMFVVNLDRDDSGKAFCDKTLDEIVTAFNNGMLPVIVDPDLYLYNLTYKPSPEEGADFVSTEALPGRSEVYFYYAKIYPDGYVRTACLMLSGDLDWDDGESGKPVQPT